MGASETLTGGGSLGESLDCTCTTAVQPRRRRPSRVLFVPSGRFPSPRGEAGGNTGVAANQRKRPVVRRLAEGQIPNPKPLRPLPPLVAGSRGFPRSHTGPDAPRRRLKYSRGAWHPIEMRPSGPSPPTSPPHTQISVGRHA